MRGLLLGGWLFLAASSACAQQAVNADLLKLHDDLNLSATQEPAWRDYTLAIGPSQDTQARHRATAELVPLVPTPRRIALIEAAIAGDTEDFHRQGAAVVGFYNQLTPGQQRTFDLDTAQPSTGRR
jgi:hypothetical protein